MTGPVRLTAIIERGTTGTWLCARNWTSRPRIRPGSQNASGKLCTSGVTDLTRGGAITYVEDASRFLEANQREMGPS